MKVVFDTVIFVRSLINPHGLWGQLVFAHAHDYRLVVSAPIVLEYLDVLARPQIARKFRTLESFDLRSVLDLIRAAEIVEVPDVRAISRDPKDDIFLATAETAQAMYLVTEDRDLLDIRNHGETLIIGGATFLQILNESKETPGRSL